jgi:hypothetical protein
MVNGSENPWKLIDKKYIIKVCITFIVMSYKHFFSVQLMFRQYLINIK